MTAIDDLIRKYANETEQIVCNAIANDDARSGYYTWVGLLAEFLHEAVPHVEAAVRADIEAKGPVETPEAAAERFVKFHGEKRIQAIKDYRTWASENGHPYGLKEAKDACDEARDRLVSRGEATNRRPSTLLRRTIASHTDPDKSYLVTREYSTDFYGANPDWTDYRCSCPDFAYASGANHECKHIVEVKSADDQRRQR